MGKVKRPPLFLPIIRRMRKQIHLTCFFRQLQVVHTCCTIAGCQCCEVKSRKRSSLGINLNKYILISD